MILAGVKARQYGDYRPLDELYERVLTHRSTNTAWRQVIDHVLLAELLSEVGDVERGLAALDAIPSELRDVTLASEIRRVRGELLLGRNQRDEGERLLREAIEMARRRSERILELRGTTSLARVWRQQGRRDEARRMLADIYAWFTEGFDTQDLRTANALLQELEE